MVAKMDAGAIISQRAIPITGEDDVASMFEKLSVVGADLLIETLPEIFAGTITEVEQDEALVSFSPNISREQEQIDWNKTATEVDCFVRGLRPWPTSFTVLNGNRVKMWGVSLTDKQTAKTPGSLFIDGGRLYVACGGGTVLEITRLQPAGKAQMDAKAFINGFSEWLKNDAIFEGLNHE
jgi:methionyl-tRNA formyltransferase